MINVIYAIVINTHLCDKVRYGKWRYVMHLRTYLDFA